MARLVKLGELKPGEDILAEHLRESLSDDYLILKSFDVGREVDVAVLAHRLFSSSKQRTEKAVFRAVTMVNGLRSNRLVRSTHTKILLIKLVILGKGLAISSEHNCPISTLGFRVLLCSPIRTASVLGHLVFEIGTLPLCC